jgi:O-antigen biosynthesis alpha-1,2-mannosyltransferase
MDQETGMSQAGFLAESGPVPRKVGIMLRHIRAPGGMNVLNRHLVRYLATHPQGIEYHLLYSSAEQHQPFADLDMLPVVLPSYSRLHWDQVVVPRYARKAGLDLVLNGKFSIPLSSDTATMSFIPGAEQLVVPWIFPATDRMYNRFMLPVFCRSATGIVTCTETGKQDIVRLTGADPAHVHVVPLGVDPWLRPAGAAAKASLRARYRLDGPYVLFLGGISPLKNLGNLLRALALLPSELSVDLVIAGFTRWLFQQDLDLIRELNLEARVRQVGFVPDEDLAALYSAAECLVLPSWYEGFGIPIVEAMACGCPVITSDRGGGPEVAGGAAFLVDPASPAAIAQAIQRVLTDGSVRERQTAAGLDRAAQFDWDRTNRRLAALITDLLDSRPRHARRPTLDAMLISITHAAASIVGLLGTLLSI